MKKTIATAFLLISLFAGKAVFAQSNPFTGGPVHEQQDNNLQTDTNTYEQDPSNVHNDPNVNTDYNVNTETNVNEEYNAYSQDQNLTVENYINDQKNINEQYNPLTDPNLNQDIYLNEQYNPADTYNPFWGIGFNKYDPWQQQTFGGTYQSWYGYYNDPKGTEYKADVNDTFNEKDQSQLKQFKFGTGNLFNKGVVSSSNPSCTATFKTFADIIYYFVCIINTFLLQLALTLGFLYFAWGVSQYVMATGNAEERLKARHIMIYGLVALFVVFSVWGIVKLIKVALGI